MGSLSSPASANDVAVVMLPFGAQGHMTPMFYLAGRLVSAKDHKISVYFTGTSHHIHRIKDRVHGWDPSSAANMHFHEYPPLSQTEADRLDSINASFTARLVSISREMRVAVYEIVQQLSAKYRKIVVIYDYLMSYHVQDVDSIDNVEAYRFNAVSDCYSFCHHYKKSDQAVPPEVAAVLKATTIPKLNDPEAMEFHQENAKRIFSGDIYNANRKIQSSFLDLLERDKMAGSDKVWALGPLSTIPDHHVASKTRHESLDFLDKQEEPSSVVFVSFGTTCSFSDEQIGEIAMALERSELKFIWILRDADIEGGSTRKPLPLGFEERMKGRGLIVRDWAPQMEILSHVATGGFLSHCGWGSVMESISCGLAMATWPILFDHPSNAAYVTKVLRIGVEVVDRECREEIVKADTIEKALRTLMASEEGEEIRERAKELGNVVRKSMVEDGNEMSLFISQITR